MTSKRSRPGASQSFTDGEVELLDQLFRALLQGKDTSRLIRNPLYGRLCRKFAAMKQKLRDNPKPLANDDKAISAFISALPSGRNSMIRSGRFP